MWKLESEEKQELKLFLFLQPGNKSYMNLGYNLDEAMRDLPRGQWQFGGNVPVKNLLKDVEVVHNIVVKDEPVPKELSRPVFVASLKMTQDKFTEGLNQNDKTALKRIIKKLELCTPSAPQSVGS